MNRNNLVARALTIKLLDRAEVLKTKKVKTDKEVRELERLQEMKTLLERVGVK